MYDLEPHLLSLLMIQVMKFASEVVIDMVLEPPHSTAWSSNPIDP